MIINVVNQCHSTDLCEPGKYMTVTGCRLCPLGTYSYAGAAECIKCPENTHAAAGAPYCEYGM